MRRIKDIIKKAFQYTEILCKIAFLVIAAFLSIHLIRRPSYEPGAQGNGDFISLCNTATMKASSETIHEDPNIPPFALAFSHYGGLFAQPFYLELTTNIPDARIFFTLDGSKPTPSGAYLFTQPLHIINRTPEENILSAIPGYRIGCFIVYWRDYYIPPDYPVFKATVIRAQVFNYNDKPLSDIITHSFFISEDIFTRYYGLPIFSIVTDAANLFDDEIGIYVRGHNNQGGHQRGDPTPNWQQRGREWERPIHLEMFEPGCQNFERAIAMNMGVRIHGGDSRRLAQKSFRLYPRSYYDPLQSNIRYDIFRGAATDSFGEPVDVFGRLLLRAFGNEGTGTMFRDAGLQYLSRYLNVGIQAYRPAVVFVNGEFWGLYNIRERFCERYVASHFHVDRNSVTILSACMRGGFVIDVGDEEAFEDFLRMEEFFMVNSMEHDINFETAKSLIDIDSLMDAFIANIYFGNADWPGNNNRFWRYTGTPSPYLPASDGRWRWLLPDLDATTAFPFGFNYWEDTLYRILHIPAERSAIRHDSFASARSTNIFRSLMENADFKAQFVNRFNDIMNTYFQEQPFLDMIETFSGNIRHVVPEQIQRWGRIYSMEEWEEDVERLRDFAQGRQEYMLSFLQANLNLGEQITVSTIADQTMGRIAVNGIIIDPDITPGVGNASNWSGIYFEGMSQTFYAIPLDGYVFAGFLVDDADGITEHDSNPLVVVLDGDIVVSAVFVSQ